MLKKKHKKNSGTGLLQLEAQTQDIYKKNKISKIVSLLKKSACGGRVVFSFLSVFVILPVKCQFK